MFHRRPHFGPSEIDRICDDELRSLGLYPATPSPIRIDRFIEKRFSITTEYEELPSGVLGFTKFDKTGVRAIVLLSDLDLGKGTVAERRGRTTMAHEAGHGLLHAHLFATEEAPQGLFDTQSEHDERILCRDVEDGTRRRASYDGRWWEFQANRAIGGLLCPRDLVIQTVQHLVAPEGFFGIPTLDKVFRPQAVRTVSEVFDVNPIVARIRLMELYPDTDEQAHL